jgi:hypothetical protein
MATWLDAERGYALDWVTQRWVQLTGRVVDVEREAWLAGPVGDTDRIGSDFYERLAAREGLRVRATGGAAGLMTSFSQLAGPDFDPERVHPAVRDFYERTSVYTLDVWSQWNAIFRPFGGLLAAWFSRRLQQMNVPLSPLATIRGMTSAIVQLEDRRDGSLRYTGWLRENRATGLTVYVGIYSVARIPGHAAPCVKVVFPLPNGSATVFMRPSVQEDGALLLESVGESFGDPGFYFLVRKKDSFYWVRFLRTFRESIRVYVEPPGELRTDHRFTIFGRTFLQLHYRLHGAAK